MIPSIQAALLAATLMGCFGVFYAALYALRKYLVGVERLANRK